MYEVLLRTPVTLEDYELEAFRKRTKRSVDFERSERGLATGEMIGATITSLLIVKSKTPYDITDIARNSSHLDTSVLGL